MNAKTVLEELLERVKEHEQRIHEQIQTINHRIEANKASLDENQVDLSHFPKPLQQEIQHFIRTKIKKLPPKETQVLVPPSKKKKRSTLQREIV